MNRGGKTIWKAIRVRGPGDAGELVAAERLAALYHFQNGERAPGHCFIDALREAEVTDPAEVDWSSFPVLAALEAVTCDELRRLRLLLRGSAADAQAAPSRSSAWGLDV
jgi:hypothetical protein